MRRPAFFCYGFVRDQSSRQEAATSAIAAESARMCQGLLFLALSSSSGMANEPKFQRVQTQFIAAAIDPVHGEGMKASSGTGAGDWGIWRVDPGPRGVQLRGFDRLQSTGGVAPRGWKFDQVQSHPMPHPKAAQS